MTYVKLGRMAFFGHAAEFRGWRGSKVSPRHGQVGYADVVLPLGLEDYLAARAEHAANAMAQLSNSQREVIAKSWQENRDRVQGSELVEAIDRDIEMFGKEKVFASSQKS